MAIRRLTKREQRILSVCLVLIFVYLGFNVLIKPLRNQIASLGRKTESLNRQLRSDKRLIQRGKAVESQYDFFVEEYKQSKTSEQVMSSIFSEIEEVAGQLNLPISDLKPKKVKKEDYYNRFAVSLTLNSELINIIHFLYNLQGEPHRFYVDEARFDKVSRRNSSEIKTHLVLSKIQIP